MKKIIILLLVLLSGTYTYSQDTKQITPKTKLLVYYFHITNRCHTCTTIEATTRKVLLDNFKTELDSAIIVFNTFNVDSAANQAISKKYDAYGATLALTQIINGKEKIVDMSNFAFSKINNESLFTEGLVQKIKELIK
ncbi:MAG: nitrophenyl compound nitroreductase subunit ArsF family protein [Bacteroidetes bacterium]|nr:nitrophenyl compound nitroreductase subunit ArsF family protein [Bacteroidota bacterium]